MKQMGRDCEISDHTTETWKALAKVDFVIFTKALTPTASHIGDLIDTI